jgi:hypothetical protein
VDNFQPRLQVLDYIEEIRKVPGQIGGKIQFKVEAAAALV